MTAALLPVVIRSTTDACPVCTDGAVLAWQPGSVIAVAMPCPHCKGWALVDLTTWGRR